MWQHAGPTHPGVPDVVISNLCCAVELGNACLVKQIIHHCWIGEGLRSQLGHLVKNLQTNEKCELVAPPLPSHHSPVSTLFTSQSHLKVLSCSPSHPSAHRHVCACVCVLCVCVCVCVCVCGVCGVCMYICVWCVHVCCVCVVCVCVCVCVYMCMSVCVYVCIYTTHRSLHPKEHQCCYSNRSEHKSLW